MRRSEVNAALRSAEACLREQRFALPRWARWSPDAWRRADLAADEIRSRRLGWDVTDFGRHHFARFGLTLFTLRNGVPPHRGRKCYAEKVMLAAEGQHNPLHFHFDKIEDIINRGGGILCLELHASDAAEAPVDASFEVAVDGVRRTVRSGAVVELDRGESITVEPRVYHRFWAKPGSGRVLIGEVSSVNDDEQDNRFTEPIARFSQIEEDEPPLYLLCNEYPAPRTAGGA